MTTARRLIPLACALLLLSCASASQLAIQSERELVAGNARRAYEKARKAVDKEPGNPHARAAMAAAATRLVEEWKRRTLTLAEVDTVAAARYSLELRSFRGELSRYQIEVPDDRAFADRERLLRSAAAGIYYWRGRDALAGGRPKRAWFELRSVREFELGYRDTETRIQEAFRAARTRVAILPFANQTGVPGLSQEITDLVYAEVVEGLDREQHTFTVLIEPERVYEQVTVSQLTEMPRSAALEVARKLRADRVVYGRFHSLRSSTNSDHYQQIIYHHVVEQDGQGHRVDSFVEQPFDAVVRERHVAVSYEMEVLDLRSRAPIASHMDVVEAVARVVWTDFQAVGDCGRYALVPATVRKTEPAKGKQADERWTKAFGEWTLPALLERARKDRQRKRYERRYRGEFLTDSRKRPVFLAELPSENDLAYVALHPIAQPVVETLRELDAKD
ncbi:MAG TPA: hypothetical protein VEY91_11885 [Candidatus Limnocylindria bacterium]|nr:hypothetical protein [Candidatus Limnocylindria bacterium]